MTTPPTVLDAAFLKDFINVLIPLFQVDLEIAEKEIARVDVERPSETAGTLVATKPLILGNMSAGATATTTGGDGSSLNKAVSDALIEIKRIINEQKLLFGDISSALEETVKELEALQATNMEAITPEAFMNIFEDVDSAFHGSGGEDDV